MYETAKSLKHAVRTDDLVGRWGGEEFLVVFSLTRQENLELFAKRMRMLMETSSVQRDGENVQVTVSVGAVAVHEHTSKEKIIRLADQLMNQSKQNGRTCITIQTI